MTPERALRNALVAVPNDDLMVGLGVRCWFVDVGTQGGMRVGRSQIVGILIPSANIAKISGTRSFHLVFLTKESVGVRIFTGTILSLPAEATKNLPSSAALPPVPDWSWSFELKSTPVGKDWVINVSMARIAIVCPSKTLL